MRVVGDQSVGLQGPEYVTLDALEQWQASNLFVGDSVNTLGHRLNPGKRPNQPARQLPDDATDNANDGQFHQVRRVVAVTFDVYHYIVEACPVSHVVSAFQPISARPCRRSW